MAKITVPRIHAIGMAPPLAGKSTFFATWVDWSARNLRKPGLVIGWDSPTKFDPYRMLGDRTEEVVDPRGFLVSNVSRGDTLVCRILHFFDRNPKKPQAYAQFEEAWPEIEEQVNLHRQWGCVILDSATFMENACNYRNQYLKYPNDQNDRKYGWASFNTRDMREILHCRMVSLLCHVGIAVHIHDKPEETPQGGLGKQPHVPGALRPALAGAYNAMVRLEWVNGSPVLRTKPGDGYVCGTSPLIDAADPCHPSFAGLIDNCVKRQKAAQTVEEPAA